MITEYLSWPWVFYLNVPIALLIIAVVAAVVPAGGQRRGSVDTLGAITVTAGLALAVFGIVRAPEAGWLAAETLLPVGAATIMIMIGMVALAPRLIGRFRPKAMAVTGLALLAVGMAWLALVRPDGNFWPTSCPPRTCRRWACRWRSSRPSALSAARPEEGGLASGIVNTSYQVGSALGLAAITALATVQGAGALGDPVRLTSGNSAAFVGAAVIALAGAVLAASAAPALHRGADAAGALSLTAHKELRCNTSPRSTRAGLLLGAQPARRDHRPAW